MFDIQRFGYNDTVTSSENIQFEFGFVDADTRTANVPNPKDAEDIEASDVAAFSTWIETNAVIIGDKTGAASAGINAATRVTKTTTKLDLS